MANNFMLNLPRRTTGVILQHVQRRFMPVNVPPTATGKRRFRLEVEKDPHKLVNYCCGLNFHIDEPLVPLKPDSEYPEWLWSLRLGPKPKSWELEPGTKEYYLQLRKEEVEREAFIKSSKGKQKKITGKVLLEQAEYVHRLRFAALAHLEDDVGFDSQSTENSWYAHLDKTIRSSDYYLPINDHSVIYKDKIEGNSKTKSYFFHRSSFNIKQSEPREKKPRTREAIQDSRRRHIHSVY